MKKVLALLLAICICASLCACDSIIPQPEPPIIESGMKIDTLYDVFSAPEEDYQETVLSSTRTAFSFRNDEFVTQGLLCGEDVIEFSWTFPGIYAETYDEFSELVDLLKTNMFGFSEEQKSSVQIVLFTMVGIMKFDPNASMSMGELIAAIVHGTEHQVGNWVWHVERNTTEHTAVFYAKYQG